MIEVKISEKDCFSRCHSCYMRSSRKNVYTVKLGLEEVYAHTARLCEECLSEVSSQFNAVKKEREKGLSQEDLDDLWNQVRHVGEVDNMDEGRMLALGSVFGKMSSEIRRLQKILFEDN